MFLIDLLSPNTLTPLLVVVVGGLISLELKDPRRELCHSILVKHMTYEGGSFLRVRHPLVGTKPECFLGSQPVTLVGCIMREG